jgi:hypothetical protein
MGHKRKHRLDVGKVRKARKGEGEGKDGTSLAVLYRWRDGAESAEFVDSGGRGKALTGVNRVGASGRSQEISTIQF